MAHPVVAIQPGAVKHLFSFAVVGHDISYIRVAAPDAHQWVHNFDDFEFALGRVCHVLLHLTALILIPVSVVAKTTRCPRLIIGQSWAAN